MSAGASPPRRPVHGHATSSAYVVHSDRVPYDGRRRGEAPLKHRGSRFPGSLIAAIVVLAIVIIVVIVLALEGVFHGPLASSGGAIVLAKAGDQWMINGTEYQATMFTTGQNGTFWGNFTIKGTVATVIVVFMNETEEDRFVNTSTLTGFYDSGRTNVGVLNVTIRPPGNFYLYIYNPNTDPVTITWQSAGEFVPI